MLPIRNNMQVVYRHRRLAVNGLVEDIMKQGDSKLTETNPTYLYEEKLSSPPPPKGGF